jgi:hypothetical protein
MKLTPKLLGYLNRVFDKDPVPFIGFRVHYDGALTWAIADGILTFTAAGGSGASHTFDLSAYSIRTLVGTIAGLTGYSASSIESARAGLSALVLLDGGADIATTNGDAVFGYTSLLYAFIEACSVQLQAVRTQIAQAIFQMNTRDASGQWLDELGGYFGVPRAAGEVDALYGPRIIAQTLRPLANNVAMEMSIEAYTGQPVSVLDVVIYRGVFPVYDGTITHNSAYNYATVGNPNYGLFDVAVNYDLEGGGSISGFLTTVQSIVNLLRAANTHLRSLALSSIGSPLIDAVDPPTDTFSDLAAMITAISEAFAAPTDTFAPLVAGFAAIVEAVPPPTELAIGGVYTQLRTEGGSVITTSGGDPILASIGSLFV